jgi:hypothetical protein
LPGSNTLAYLASSSATKKKSFITLTPGLNVIKLFFSSLTLRVLKLKAFVLGKPLQPEASNLKHYGFLLHLNGEIVLKTIVFAIISHFHCLAQ